MKSKLRCDAAFLVVALIFFSVALGTGVARAQGGDRCAALAAMNFEALPEAPMKIISARLVTVEAGGLSQPPNPMTWPIDRNAVKTYCQVSGYAGRQSAFELRLPLPEQWNKKFFFFACAGFCGNVDGNGCNAGLAQGYASITSNGGHMSAPGFDGLWALDDVELQMDFAHRSSHAVTVAGKAITKAFYGAAPVHSYMAGCSKGGQATLMAALKYPADFDGIIPVAPVYDYTGRSVIEAAWVAQANSDGKGGYIVDAKAAQIAHDAFIQACDTMDGVKDGLVTDPVSCPWKPSDVACAAGKNPDECLSPAQVKALEKIYSAPRNSKGERLFPVGNALGSETEWSRWVFRPPTGGQQGSMEQVPTRYGESVAGPDSRFPPSANILVAQQYLRYLAFDKGRRPVGDDPLKFNFDADPAQLKRARAIYDATSVDLRAFKARGGKVLMWQGWADAGSPAGSAIDYYLRTMAFLGGREKTEEFFRLFLLPGVHHCGGGPGPDQIDALSALDAWVDRGQAPKELLTVQGSGPDQGRVRPVYPYPVVPQYKGSGSAREASSFAPFDPWKANPQSQPIPGTVYGK